MQEANAVIPASREEQEEAVRAHDDENKTPVFLLCAVHT